MANNNVLNVTHIRILRKKRLILYSYIKRLALSSYGSLIRKGDADQLRDSKGQVVAVLCSKDGGSVYVSVKTFEAVIERKKWTHLAIVASDENNSNRLTVYIVSCVNYMLL